MCRVVSLLKRHFSRPSRRASSRSCRPRRKLVATYEAEGDDRVGKRCESSRALSLSLVLLLFTLVRGRGVLRSSPAGRQNWLFGSEAGYQQKTQRASVWGIRTASAGRHHSWRGRGKPAASKRVTRRKEERMKAGTATRAKPGSCGPWGAGGGCHRDRCTGDRRFSDPGTHCEARPDRALQHRGTRGWTAARQGAGCRARTAPRRIVMGLVRNLLLARSA